VASYASPGTRQAYATQLRLWFDWCEKHHLEPLADVRRPHVELYARGLEARGLAAATVALKLVVLTGFYRYCVEEQLLEHSPAVHVRRPKVSQESTRLGLDRTELGAFLVQAGLSGATTTSWPACSPSAPSACRKPAAQSCPTWRSPTDTAWSASWARATSPP
jgi:site-specific recombinase XerD